MSLIKTLIVAAIGFVVGIFVFNFIRPKLGK